VAKHSGGLELTWTDKDKAILSVGDGEYDYTFVDPSDYRVSEVRLLHLVEQVEAEPPADRPDGLPEPTRDNLLITGDAMHALDALSRFSSVCGSSSFVRIKTRLPDLLRRA
jgi:adenine-specific DNA-methyltransferase